MSPRQIRPASAWAATQAARQVSGAGGQGNGLDGLWTGWGDSFGWSAPSDLGIEPGLNVWAAAHEILDCIDAMGCESSSGQRQSEVWIRAYARERRLHDSLALEFGRRRGWRWSPAPACSRIRRFFGGSVWEAVGSVWEAFEEEAERIAPPPRYDHPSFYSAGGDLVAVVSQPYDFSVEDRHEALEWARARGLAFWRLVDFPSWWYPGQTTLCVFARPEAMLGGQALEGNVHVMEVSGHR